MTQYTRYPVVGGGGGSGVSSLNTLTGAVTLAAGSGISLTPVGNTITITNIGGGSGTVTSVALTAPAIFSVAGSPVTTSGTLALSLATQLANRVWAGPTSGGAATPTFRALVALDIPALSYVSTSLTNASIIVGSVGGTATAVSLSGDATIIASGALTIANNVVSNAKLAQMAAHTIKGNNTGSTANALDLTGTQVTAELDAMVGDSGAGGTKGLAPAPAAGDAAAGKYLSAGGIWSVPAGGGGGSGTVTTVSVVSANGLAGTVATATTTPAITLSTTITGLLKGNGTAISAAVSNTDYQAANAQLTAISGLGANGIITRTAAGTTSVRTVTGTSNQITVTNGDGVAGNPTLALDPDMTYAEFGITIDGGGTAITTGVKGYIELPWDGTITGWTLLGDQTGSIVVAVWKDTYANYPPNSADSITGADVPTISASNKGQNLTLSTWTTAVTRGDVVGFNVNSCSAITRATLTVRVTKG